MQEKYISGEKGYKYWIQKRVDDSSGLARSIYYFDKSGKFLYFFKNNDGEFGKYDAIDVIFVEKWEIIRKNVINMNGTEYNILTLNDSIFILSGANGNDTLISITDDLIPFEYQKLQ